MINFYKLMRVVFFSERNHFCILTSSAEELINFDVSFSWRRDWTMSEHYEVKLIRDIWVSPGDDYELHYFWNVTTWSLVEVYQRFVGWSHLHFQCRKLSRGKIRIYKISTFMMMIYFWTFPSSCFSFQNNFSGTGLCLHPQVNRPNSGNRDQLYRLYQNELAFYLKMEADSNLRNVFK